MRKLWHVKVFTKLLGLNENFTLRKSQHGAGIEDGGGSGRSFAGVGQRGSGRSDLGLPPPYLAGSGLELAWAATGGEVRPRGGAVGRRASGAARPERRGHAAAE